MNRNWQRNRKLEEACSDSNDPRELLKPSHAAAPPVAGSCIFDPSFLLGDQALNKLGPLLLVGLNPFVQQHLTDLRDGPLFLISDLLNVAPQFRIHSEY